MVSVRGQGIAAFDIITPARLKLIVFSDHLIILLCFGVGEGVCGISEGGILIHPGPPSIFAPIRIRPIVKDVFPFLSLVPGIEVSDPQGDLRSQKYGPLYP